MTPAVRRAGWLLHACVSFKSSPNLVIPRAPEREPLYILTGTLKKHPPENKRMEGEAV